jgi:predicted regulator of Ras-like GTPase activity (Roadblock/LC7/MglB family)
MTMTPLMWMWILSIAGALAFFGAGALAASRRATRVTAIAPPLARALSEVAALDDDRRRLADELTKMSRELSEVRHARPGATDDPSRVIEIDTLKRRLAEAEELREENARLRTQSARARDLATRVSVLETELAKARTIARASVSANVVPSRRSVAARPTQRLATSPGTASLDALVTEMRADPKVKSAVISDELGLLVAGAGEGAETMAALGGYLAGVGVRAQGLLHMDAAARIVVEDDHGQVLTATRLDGAPLVAVTLSRP